MAHNAGRPAGHHVAPRPMRPGVRLDGVAADGETDHTPTLISMTIDLAPAAAVSAAEAKGVNRIRVTEVGNGRTVGMMDMALVRNRLDLFDQGGRVVFAEFPSHRHAGEWPGSRQ